jgi:2-polyprenyl-3-methyl-5-hydroxy-6-metoxy-1,4-benzoquinol methylase
VRSFRTDRVKLDAIVAARREGGASFPRIGIFLVSYNASHRVVQTILRIPPELREVVEEIYVFDDFSKDDTFQVAKDLARSEQWAAKLKAFRNPRNFGYGGNQKIGFAYALERGLDYVVLLHGDGQYAPEVLPDLLWPVLHEGADVVFGSRMLEPCRALRGGMPLYKWVGNRILTAFENLVLNMDLSEFHSGYRVYSTAVLTRIPFEANSDGFHFDTQIIIQCRALGAKIRQVGIPTYYGDEICHVNGLKYAWDVCHDVVDYRLHQLHLVRRQRYIVDRDEKYRFKESPFSSHSLIIEKVASKSLVLDVGCGRGLLAKALARRQAHIIGVDALPPERIEAEVAEYHQLDLEQHEKLDLRRQFDYVILADVIEHLRNEEDILRYLRRILKPDGRLIISTGNVAVWFYRISLLIGRFNYGPRGILDRTHVKLYTRSTFRRLIEKCGYKVRRFDYTNLPFELVFESTARSRILRAVDHLYHLLTRLWPTLFAYQFVAEAEIRSLEPVEGEGLIFGRPDTAATPGADALQPYDVEEGTTPQHLLVRAGHVGEGLGASAYEVPVSGAESREGAPR